MQQFKRFDERLAGIRGKRNQKNEDIEIDYNQSSGGNNDFVRKIEKMTRCLLHRQKLGPKT